MDKEYWEAYYQKHSDPFPPSDFAKFSLGYLQRGDVVLELGAGNGRDAVFFGAQGIKTIGLEQCQNVVNDLNSRQYRNVEFRAQDFSISQKEFNHDHVYSRFTLHSVPEHVATKVLRNTKESLNGYLFIETRADVDGATNDVKSHYRRFVDFEKLLYEMLEIGFKIKYAEVDRGFSKCHSEYESDDRDIDPPLIRIVAY